MTLLITMTLFPDIVNNTSGLMLSLDQPDTLYNVVQPKNSEISTVPAQTFLPPSLQLMFCPAVRSLEQRDHHLAVGQEDGAHGSPGDCLVRVLRSVLAMEVIERHPHRRPSGQTESLGR